VYADDTAFFIKDATDATDCLSSFSHSSSVFGLHTSWPKTKLQSVGSDSGPDLLNVVVDGNPVDLMESFTYLGSIQTSDGYCRSDITRRIGLASSAMSSLNNIWITKHLSNQMKVRVHQTLVLSILLYASETWTSLASDMRAIESFHMKCQRRILGIRWHDFVRNSEVSLRTGLAPVSDRIARDRNAIFGHVARLPDHSSTPGHTTLSRAIGWSTPRPFMETSTRSTTYQMDRPTPPRQQQCSHCYSVKASHWSRSLESDATVHYALTSTTDDE